MKIAVVHDYFTQLGGAEKVAEGFYKAGRSSSFAKSQLEQLVYRRANLVIVLSKAFAELAVSLYRIDPQRLRIVPGAVDVARFSLDGTREQSRSLLNLPVDRPILLSVRRLVQQMGLGLLIYFLYGFRRSRLNSSSLAKD